MARSIIPATTASGEAVIVEATPAPYARDGTRGRVLAQLEHNAMAALGLVRAGFSGLQSVSRLLDRAAQTLGQNRVVLEAVQTRELQGAFSELVEEVQTRAHAEQVLLQGATVSFALDDPWLEASELLFVQLPELRPSVLGAEGIASTDFGPLTSASHVMHRINGVRNAVAQGHVSLQHAVRRLNVVVVRLNANRGKSTPVPASPDEFQRFSGRVRDHVLRSGASALRVQGTPSTRAASLVEGAEDGV